MNTLSNLLSFRPPAHHSDHQPPRSDVRRRQCHPTSDISGWSIASGCWNYYFALAITISWPAANRTRLEQLGENGKWVLQRFSYEFDGIWWTTFTVMERTRIKKAWCFLWLYAKKTPGIHLKERGSYSLLTFFYFSVSFCCKSCKLKIHIILLAKLWYLSFIFPQ